MPSRAEWGECSALHDGGPDRERRETKWIGAEGVTMVWTTAILSPIFFRDALFVLLFLCQKLTLGEPTSAGEATRHLWDLRDLHETRKSVKISEISGTKDSHTKFMKSTSCYAWMHMMQHAISLLCTQKIMARQHFCRFTTISLL